jgi:hypothetical protein
MCPSNETGIRSEIVSLENFKFGIETRTALNKSKWSVLVSSSRAAFLSLIERIAGCFSFVHRCGRNHTQQIFPRFVIEIRAFGWRFWNQQENRLKEKDKQKARKSCDSLVKKKTSATEANSGKEIPELEIKVAHSAHDWRRAKDALGREYAFLEVPDPRHPKSRRHPLPAMLSLIALVSQSQREAIRLRVRDKQTKRLKMPGYDALNDLLAAVDPEAYAQALTA